MQGYVVGREISFGFTANLRGDRSWLCAFEIITHLSELLFPFLLKSELGADHVRALITDESTPLGREKLLSGKLLRDAVQVRNLRVTSKSFLLITTQKLKRPF